MEIVPPTPRVHASFLAAWDEFDAEDGQGADWTTAFGHERAQVADAEGFAAMCARRGIATALVRAGLDELAGVGVAQALVTCDAGNVPSARIIEAAGGVLESPPDHKRRYLVPTA